MGAEGTGSDSLISSFGAMATSFMSLKERLHGVVLQVTRARGERGGARCLTRFVWPNA